MVPDWYHSRVEAEMHGENGIPETPDWIPEQREAPEWIRPEVKPTRQLCKQSLDGRGEQ